MALRSVRHCDAALKLKRMDDYILGCIVRSAAKPGQEQVNEMRSLLKANQEFKFVTAALTLKLAELTKDAEEKHALLNGFVASPDPGLAGYRAMAKKRLDELTK